MGEALAASTGRPFLDTDRMVEERARKTVSQVFESFGEAAFRALERDAVARALRRAGTVVALGGGAAMQVSAHPGGTAVVRLRAKRDTLAVRLLGSGRPSLRGRPLDQELDVLLAEREPVHARLASLTVDTDGREPGEVAAEIAEALNL